jgi:uncharacterized protein YqjF (DUF2071 family)
VVRPEPVTATPSRGVRPALLHQDWREVAFLHWAIDPERAAPRLPRGTRPDVFLDRTFVGIVALRMQRTALLAGPAIPWLGTFGQINVRLYSVDESGRRGVVFLSLDADRLPPALGARQTTRLPYAWGRVRVDRQGDYVKYSLDRRRPAGVHHRVAGRTLYGQVEHGPWPLHAAELVDLDTDLLDAAGLPESGPPASVLFSPGVDRVRIGPPAR